MKKRKMKRTIKDLSSALKFERERVSRISPRLKAHAKFNADRMKLISFCEQHTSLAGLTLTVEPRDRRVVYALCDEGKMEWALRGDAIEYEATVFLDSIINLGERLVFRTTGPISSG